MTRARKEPAEARPTAQISSILTQASFTNDPLSSSLFSLSFNQDRRYVRIRLAANIEFNRGFHDFNGQQLNTSFQLVCLSSIFHALRNAFRRTRTSTVEISSSLKLHAVHVFTSISFFLKPSLDSWVSELEDAKLPLGRGTARS